MGAITGNGQAQTGLGGAAGFGEVALARSDSAAFVVDTSAVFENGFSLGGVSYAANALFVSTDGFLTFGAAPTGDYFNSPSSLSTPFIAAFMADIDTRLDGEGTESGPIWVDVDALADVVTITWQDVGFYRRNAGLTNTFQIQLFDRGAAGMDVVFRYDTILWTSGDLQGGWGGLDGDGATIAIRTADEGPFGQLAASGDGAAQLNLPSTIGNTGVAGLWVFNVPGAGAIGGLPPPQVDPGSAGNDVITGFSGADTLLGNAGNDVMEGGAGADLLNGGFDFDLASYAGANEGVVANLANPAVNTADAAGDLYISIEGLLGSAFGDVLTGNALPNLINGGAGNDTLMGGLGADTLIGGAGFDWADYTSATGPVVASLANWAHNAAYALGDQLREIEGLMGGAYADMLTATASGSFLVGGAGNDTLRGGAGADRLHGGIGLDWASYEGLSAVGLDLNNMALSTGAALGDVYDSIEGVIGSGWADVMRGSTRHDMLAGGAGNDLMQGAGGNDSLWGDSGNDTLIGGAGADQLEGGAGIDWASYADALGAVRADLLSPSRNTGDAVGDGFAQIEGLIGSNFSDTLTGDSMANWISGGTGQDVIDGGAGADYLRAGLGNDSLYGGTSNDSIYGDDGNDLLSGIDGNDKLYGGNGADRLYGNKGNDHLYGADGRDTLVGGSGLDYLYGGSDRDVFKFNSPTEITKSSSSTDVIYDFRRGTDKIDLSAIDASTKFSGNNRFTFDGTSPHGTSKYGDVYYKKFNYAGSKKDFTLIYIDNDADKYSEAVIKVMGLHSFTSRDFIL